MPRLHFSRERRQQLETRSDDLVEHALDVHDEFHASSRPAAGSRWQLVRQKRSLSIYRERGKRHESEAGDGRKRARVILCSGVVPGTIADMLNGTYADSTESLRIGLSLLTDQFLDGSMLHVFERNALSSAVVFSGIKWVALKTPSSAALIHDRDVLSYQRIGRIVDRRSRVFVYLVAQSVDLPEFPANRQRNLERATISMCYLFRQVQTAWVGCFSLGSASLGGALPRSIGELIAAERMLAVGNFLRVAHAKAFSALMTASADRLPSSSAVCDVCMSLPKVLDGPHKLCMGCRRKVCKKCRETRTVFRLVLRTRRPDKETFCSQCVAQVTSSASRRGSTPPPVESASRRGRQPSSTGAMESPASETSETSEMDSDAWLPPAPELPADLGGLASFVAGARQPQPQQQWNQRELDYLADLLRDSGLHGQAKSGSRQPHSNTSSSSHSAAPDDSLSPAAAREPDEEADASPRKDKYFTIDELD
ncbi:hypothetical protein BBJ28_00019588 [Nothophytophthora sp. Chile5]|nr:hypothetical protein BBJ28_00019588 [Nothophytophthora sp. Chile5]